MTGVERALWLAVALALGCAWGLTRADMREAQTDALESRGVRADAQRRGEECASGRMADWEAAESCRMMLQTQSTLTDAWRARAARCR